VFETRAVARGVLRGDARRQPEPAGEQDDDAKGGGGCAHGWVSSTKVRRSNGRLPLESRRTEGSYMNDTALRAQLATLLGWHDAHVDLEAALADLPVGLRGRVPPGSPYSIWQLVEHLRIALHDILDFCVNPAYKEMHWPDDYWPKRAAPSESEWTDAL